MTAIPDRRSDSDAEDIPVPWDQRPIVGERRGLPWWGAVLLAFGLAVLGAVIDMQTQNTLGWLFQGAYFVGAVVAVCGVQRRSLFGPMVQPPLILGVTVPGVVLLVSGLPENSDMLSRALAVGTPLINGFPTMAITTGCTLVLGIVRLYRERDPDAKPKVKTGDGKRPTDPKRPGGAGRGGAARGDAPRGRRPAEDRPVSDEDRPGGSGGRAAMGRRPGRRPADDAPRAGRSAADDAPRRGRRSADGAARRPVEDDPRREAGGRSAQMPPPGRRPRQRGGIPPEEADRRGGDARAGGPPADRPRRVPPRAGDPRQDPGRAPEGRRGTPPRRRPWDDDA